MPVMSWGGQWKAALKRDASLKRVVVAAMPLRSYQPVHGGVDSNALVVTTHFPLWKGVAN
jgi:hypothetical protein